MAEEDARIIGAAPILLNQCIENFEREHNLSQRIIELAKEKTELRKEIAELKARNKTLMSSVDNNDFH
jgi:cell division protein FtsB